MAASTGIASPGAMRTVRVARLSTPSGRDTLEVDGTLLHSRYDPLKEASRQVAAAGTATHVIVLSPGLGYICDALPGRRFLLIERHAAIAAQDPGRPRLVAPDAAEVRRRVLDWEGLEEGRLAVLLGSAHPDDDGYYEDLRVAVVRAVEMRAEEVATVRGFAATWEANLKGNRRWIGAANGAVLGSRSGPDVQWLLPDRLGWRGRIVAVLAAGPSLAADLPILAELCAASGRSAEGADPEDGLGGRAPIIVAVDSALPAALAGGVVPAAVVSVDPQPVKAICLADLGGVPLLASVLSPPDVLSRAHRLLLFGQGHPGEREAGVPAPAVLDDIGGSVATAAAAIAVRAGARAVLLIGQDLAVPEPVAGAGWTHVGGTHFERSLLYALGRFSGGVAGLLRRAVPSNLRRVPAVGGGTVATTPVLDSYRQWLRELAERTPGVLFVQTTRRGASIGIPARPLPEALQIAAEATDRTDSARCP